MLLDGLHIPLTTPFYPDGRIYLRKLEHNADRYSRTPASGLSVLTSTGEASLLSDEETKQVLRTAIEASAPEKVLTADISRDGVSNTLELAEVAAALAYDALLLRTPAMLAHATGDAKARLTYFQAIADRSALPIILCDHGALPLEVVAELSANPIFIGLLTTDAMPGRLRELKGAAAATVREVAVTHVFGAVTNRMRAPQQEAAGGNYIAADALGGGGTALATAPPAPSIKTRSKKVGFQVLAGDTSRFLEALEAGAPGAMLPFAAAAPQAVYEVLAAWKDGDPRLAAEKQGRLMAAAREIEGKLGVAALKAACDLNGYYGGKPRLPLLPLSGDDRIAVESLMAGMRN